MTLTPSWSKFDTYREMKLIANGKVLVVRPSDIATVVPLFCSWCKYPFRTSDDSLAFRKAGCCDKCLLFSRGKPEETSKEQWASYLEERRTAPRPLIILK